MSLASVHKELFVFIYLLTASNRNQDPLCSLELKEKVRICMAVLNSTYFNGKVNFPSSVNWIGGKCIKKTISFQTEVGERLAARREFQEWTMDCDTNNEDDGVFDYLLSQAYEPDQIFIYTWDWHTHDLFLENLSTNVRLIINLDESADSTIEREDAEDDRILMSYPEDLQ